MHLRSPLRLLALFVAATIGSVGCAAETGSGSPIEIGSPVEIVPLPEAATMRSYSGITTRQRLVVGDDATWRSVWQQIVGSTRPAPALPTIDFASSVVIVAAMGSKPTGGYAIHVDQMRVSSAGASISVTEQSPGPGCGVTDSWTAPVAVVVAPRFTGHATFVEHTAQLACR